MNPIGSSDGNSGQMALLLLNKSLQEATKVGIVTETLDQLNQTKPTPGERIARAFELNAKIMAAAVVGKGLSINKFV